MSLTVDGEDLATRFCNIRTLGHRLTTAARRGENIPVAGRDGALWMPGKPLDSLHFPISMWVIGCDEDGRVPDNRGAQLQMRAHLDWLYGLLDATDSLVELVDTDTARRAFAEMTVSVAPSTMAGGTRAEVDLEVTIPGGCWEDATEIVSDPALLTASGILPLTGFAGGNLPLADLWLELTAPGSNFRAESADGSWIEFNGAFPAGVTRIETGPEWRAYAVTAPATDLIGSVEWGPRSRFTVPVPRGDVPAITWTASDTGAASRFVVRGRRRWRSA